MPDNKYKLLDCGDQLKVEQFGKYKLIRPCPQAMWKPFDKRLWQRPDALFERTGSEKGEWKKMRNIPESWSVESQNGLKWLITPNKYGNVGVFTEHWLYAEDLPSQFPPKSKILNLFSYTGSNCIDLVKKGYDVTVVDSSKNAITNFVDNLKLNNIDPKAARLILEDAFKFIEREVRRQNIYDVVMVDAPSYGRGTKGEVFNIEEHLTEMLITLKKIMHINSQLVLTLHSPRFTPAILKVLVSQLFEHRNVEVTEILNPCQSGVKLPSGFLVRVD